MARVLWFYKWVLNFCFLYFAPWSQRCLPLCSQHRRGSGYRRVWAGPAAPLAGAFARGAVRGEGGHALSVKRRQLFQEAKSPPSYVNKDDSSERRCRGGRRGCGRRLPARGSRVPRGPGTAERSRGRSRAGAAPTWGGRWRETCSTVRSDRGRRLGKVRRGMPGMRILPGSAPGASRSRSGAGPGGRPGWDGTRQVEHGDKA